MDAPDSPPPAEESEPASRLGVSVTVVVTLAVMGGMVAWGLRERARASERPPSAPWVGRGMGPVEADRRFEMPAGCENEPGKVPRLVFDLEKDQLDVGPMRQGQVLVRDVVFRNLGSGVLCVSAPHAACGCVRATIEGDRRMEPAESRTVKVTVDIGSRQGKQDKEVRFHTNDPTRKVATFRVIADVRLGVILLDPVVEFRMTKGRPGTAVARLKSPKDERPWEVLSVEGAEAKYEFDVEEVPSTEPDFRLVNVRLTHPGSDVQGAQADKVKIRTSHPDHAEMLLTASVRVLDRYFAAPTSVPFGGLPADREGEWFDVRLLPADPTRPVPFAGARVEGKGFEVGKSAPAGSGEWIVAVRPNTRGLSPGTAQATLVVSFDDPEFPQTRVGLTVRVIDPARRAGGVPSGTAYGRR